MRWLLYADPRIASDKILIQLFNASNLLGQVIPTGASAGGPELICEEDETRIMGHNPVLDFLNSLSV